MANFHDAYRQGATQNVAANAAGGASTQSTAFGGQTFYIVVSFTGAYTATCGLRIAIGDNPTASGTSQLVPPNLPVIFACSPGQKIAVLSNDTATPSVSVTEMS